MQAEKTRHLKWHGAETPEYKKQRVDALVLISAEMSRQTTADKTWQAWLTHDKVSPRREADVNIFDREASAARIRQHMRVCPQRVLPKMSPISLKCDFYIRAEADLASSQRNAQKNTWAKNCDCFLGWLHWKEFTVGLSCSDMLSSRWPSYSNRILTAVFALC